MYKGPKSKKKKRKLNISRNIKSKTRPPAKLRFKCVFYSWLVAFLILALAAKEKTIYLLNPLRVIPLFMGWIVGDMIYKFTIGKYKSKSDLDFFSVFLIPILMLILISTLINKISLITNMPLYENFFPA